MRPENPGRERHLRLEPEPDVGPVTVQSGPAIDRRPGSMRAAAGDMRAFSDAVVRAGWSMRLHALLGDEVARAVDAGILTVAEAEVLIARLEVVIDQAVGASEG